MVDTSELARKIQPEDELLPSDEELRASELINEIDYRNLRLILIGGNSLKIVEILLLIIALVTGTAAYLMNRSDKISQMRE